MCAVVSSAAHFLVGPSIIHLIKAQPSDRVVRIKSPRNRHEPPRLTYDTDNTLPLHDPVHTHSLFIIHSTRCFISILRPCSISPVKWIFELVLKCSWKDCSLASLLFSAHPRGLLEAKNVNGAVKSGAESLVRIQSTHVRKAKLQTIISKIKSETHISHYKYGT